MKLILVESMVRVKRGFSAAMGCSARVVLLAIATAATFGWLRAASRVAH